MSGIGANEGDAGLDLSEIIHAHTMSDSPNRILADGDSQTRAPTTPIRKPVAAVGTNDEDEGEPVTEEDRLAIKTRLVDMGLSPEAPDRASLSEREQELLDMVLKLTRTPLISSSQLIEQATLIENLRTQQLHMSQEIEDERLLWESERYGWERMAEVLISQRGQAAATGNHDELERKCSLYQSENSILKERLQLANDRSAALEAEVAKLKPILLMVPSAKHRRKRHGPINERPIADSRPGPVVEELNQSRTILTERLAAAANVVTSNASPKSPIATPPHPPPTPPSQTGHAETYHYPLAFYTPGAGPSTSPLTQVQPQLGGSTNPYLSYAISTRLNGGQSHAQWGASFQPASTSGSSPLRSFASPNAQASSSRKITQSNPKGGVKPEKPKKISSGTLSYDARTEHLLLAARKIGRERALGSYTRLAEKERDNWIAKEKERYRELKVDIGDGGDGKSKVEKKSKGKSRSGYYRSDDPGSSSHTAHPNAVNPADGSRFKAEDQMGAPSRVADAHDDRRRAQKPTTFVYVKTPGSLTATPGSGPSIASGRIIASADELERRGSNGGTLGHGARLVGPGVNPSSSGSMGAIGLPTTPHRERTSASHQATPTPGLESLLSAARSMMSEEDEAEDRERERRALSRESSSASDQLLPEVIPSSTTPKAKKMSHHLQGASRRRNAAAVDALESPVPVKRRKVAAATTGTSSSGSNAQSSRRSALKSALDVLADEAQAAAAREEDDDPVYPRYSGSQTSNIRAEIGNDSGSRSGLNVAGNGTATTTAAAISKKRNMRGRTAAPRTVANGATVSGKGSHAKVDTKGKGRALRLDDEGEQVTRKRDRAASVDDDGEPEIESIDGRGAGAAGLTSIAPEKPDHERGRPREDPSAVPANTLPTTVATPGVSTSANGRRRMTSKGRAGIPFTADVVASDSVGRSVSRPREDFSSVLSNSPVVDDYAPRPGPGHDVEMSDTLSRTIPGHSSLKLLSPPGECTQLDKSSVQDSLNKSCDTPPSLPQSDHPIPLLPKDSDTHPFTRNSVPDKHPIPTIPTASSHAIRDDKPPSKGLPTPPRDIHETGSIKGDAGHDSELDADAEADPDHDEDGDGEAELDDDVDAEGEDEEEKDELEGRP